VNYTLPFSEDTPAKLIEALAPDVLVKGGDYTVEEIAGHESVIARGGEVVRTRFSRGTLDLELNRPAQRLSEVVL
jgi:D-beta-D-heptose 7-phosphate kinase/D-beta-D-heptose 1-phosphate adenosyltransferase